MSDGQETQSGVLYRLASRNGWARAADRTNLVSTLTGADYLSLLALFIAWVSTLLIVSGEPNWAIVTMFGAFVFDKLDGFWARRTNTSSPFGRQIDSFIDIFAYLVTGALLFHYELAPNDAVSAVVGFAIVAFGGLRLVRHNAEGFDSVGSVSYYHGTTVVHTNAVVLASYVAGHVLPAWHGWLAALAVLLAAPLMISEYRAPKTTGAHLLLGVFAVGVTAFVVALEFGYI